MQPSLLFHPPLYQEPSTNNITGRIPVVIVGKSCCKLTSLAVKHAAATTSDITFLPCNLTNVRQESTSSELPVLYSYASLKITKYYCVDYRCSAVSIPIKPSSCVIWSASETVASVQLPLNSVF